MVRKRLLAGIGKSHAQGCSPYPFTIIHPNPPGIQDRYSLLISLPPCLKCPVSEHHAIPVHQLKRLVVKADLARDAKVRINLLLLF
jgi:hypothetical protein